MTAVDHRISRRNFLAGTAALAAGAMFGLPRRAFADDDKAADGAIAILFTNDVHCAVGEPDGKGGASFGYSALASYANDRRNVFGASNVTLVDAGDAVQGKVIGTVSQGDSIIDIMNACGYDYAIPGNHEFDFGMTQFNNLVAKANAKYLSCNFMDLRTGTPTPMFDSYAMREYAVSGQPVKVAFVGVTTPATLTASTPRSFWRSDDDHTRVYGFCEDETGEGMVKAVQGAVNEAKNAGADYVILLAHLGQTGQTGIWRSDELIKQCSGINVVIDGHSHEEYLQICKDADGADVVIAQTGTQFSSVGQIVISPQTGAVFASTPNYEAELYFDTMLLHEGNAEGNPNYIVFGRDADVQAVVNSELADVERLTSTVVGQSEVNLYAYEDDEYTWAVRAHETNLGDFVADAYLQVAWNNGVNADVAFVNGGGVRSNLLAGDITKGDLINVNSFNNQLCYTQVSGQDLLDALEVSVSFLPEPSGEFLQISAGLTFTVRTDIESPAVYIGGVFHGISDTAERRVRRAALYGTPIDPAATYTLVCHSYYLVDGGGSYSMLNKNPVTLLGLDNEALMEYVQMNLHGVIGQEYAAAAGAGRIATQIGPDPQPEPSPNPNPTPQPGADTGAGTGTGTGAAANSDPSAKPASQGNANKPSSSWKFAETGDGTAAWAAAAAASAAVAAGIGALAANAE